MRTFSSRFSFFSCILSLLLTLVSQVNAMPIFTSRSNATVVKVDKQHQTITLRGTTLLCYLYSRYGGLQNAADLPIYREDIGPNRGAIYYRKNNVNHTVVWLKASSEGIQVPLNLIHEYLPEYETASNLYNGLINVRPQQLYGGLMETAYSYAIAHGLTAQTVVRIMQSKPVKRRFYSLTIKQVIQRVSPSIVRLTVLGKNGVPVIQGSGVVVGEDLIATNLHVINGGHAVTANFESGRSEEVFGIVAADYNHDLVLLRAFTHGIRPLPLDDNTSAQVGDAVLAIGSPEGLGGSVSTGIVSGIRSYNGSRVIQTTAPISHGSSGGGLVDMQGRIIGITSFFDTQGQNLNFAYPAYFLRRLISHPFNQLLTWKSIEDYVPTPVSPQMPSSVFQPPASNLTSSAGDTTTYTTKTLAGIKEIQVVISEIKADAQQDGLTADAIKTAAELRLRQAGIPVVDNLMGGSQKPGLTLSLEINTLKLTSEEKYAYSIQIEAFETVSLSREIPVRSLAATWTTGNFGVVGKSKLGDIRIIINDMMDEFANNYLAQNPISK